MAAHNQRRGAVVLMDYKKLVKHIRPNVIKLIEKEKKKSNEINQRQAEPPKTCNKI